VSTVTLIDKDQIDVLNTLRASVNEEKADLEVEAKKLQDQIAEMAEKNAMQMGQINSYVPLP
jgi:protein HOOK3